MGLRLWSLALCPLKVGFSKIRSSPERATDHTDAWSPSQEPIAGALRIPKDQLGR